MEGLAESYWFAKVKGGNRPGAGMKFESKPSRSDMLQHSKTVRSREMCRSSFCVAQALLGPGFCCVMIWPSIAAAHSLSFSAVWHTSKLTAPSSNEFTLPSKLDVTGKAFSPPFSQELTERASHFKTTTSPELFFRPFPTHSSKVPNPIQCFSSDAAPKQPLGKGTNVSLP